MSLAIGELAAIALVAVLLVALLWLFGSLVAAPDPARIAPIAGLRRFAGPVLVIGGTRDRDTTVADTRMLFAAAPGAKRMWLVEGTNHVETCSLWSAEYRERLKRFFAHTLRTPVA